MLNFIEDILNNQKDHFVSIMFDGTNYNFCDHSFEIHREANAVKISTVASVTFIDLNKISKVKVIRKGGNAI